MNARDGHQPPDTQETADVAESLNTLLSRISRHTVQSDGRNAEILGLVQHKLDTLDAGSDLKIAGTSVPPQAILGRLDGIESRLHGLIDIQTEHHKALIEALGKSRQRADTSSYQTHQQTLTQLSAVLDDLIRDRQRGEIQTVAMLDTLQEAMIQVLDRIDAIHGATRAIPRGLGAKWTAPASSRHSGEAVDDTLADLKRATEAAGRDANDTPQARASLLFLREALAAHPRPLDYGREPEDIVEIDVPETAAAGAGADHAAMLPSWPRHLFAPSQRGLGFAAVALLLPLNAAALTLAYTATRTPPAAPAIIDTSLSETSSLAQIAPPAKTMSEPLESHTEDATTLPDPRRADHAATEVVRPAPARTSAQVAATPIALEGPEFSQPADGTSTAVPKHQLPPVTVGPMSLRQAAAGGDPSAQFEVASRLAEGKGVNQDFKLAINWYLRSASQGFAQAQYRLGTFYERGLGVEKDPARAGVWYKRAAEQGNVKAMHNLAVLNSNASGYEAAVQWFTEAAQHNLSDSQFNLAILHEKGLAGAKDDKLAYKWFSIAARNGDAEATRRRNAIAARMSPEDRAGLDAEISDFHAKPSVPLVNDPRVAGEDWKKRLTASNG